MPDTSLTEELAQRVEALGFELVELEQAGDRRRPILRVYADRLDTAPGQPGISLDECTAISRALEPYLDAREDLASTYLLEVSSPGVERPLVRPRDWERFAGSEVAVRGKKVLAERERRLEGTLLGLRGDASDHVGLRLPDGAEIEIPLADIDRGNLVYRWERKQRPS